MLLHEANSRLKEEITGEQLDKVHMLYCLLDFMDKDDFCKVIEAVGIEKLTEGEATYNRLFEGEKLLKAKRNYEKQKAEVVVLDQKIAELMGQRKSTAREINAYELNQKNCWMDVE